MIEGKDSLYSHLDLIVINSKTDSASQLQVGDGTTTEVIGVHVIAGIEVNFGVCYIPLYGTTPYGIAGFMASTPMGLQPLIYFEAGVDQVVHINGSILVQNLDNSTTTNYLLTAANVATTDAITGIHAEISPGAYVDAGVMITTYNNQRIWGFISRTPQGVQPYMWNEIGGSLKEMNFQAVRTTTYYIGGLGSGSPGGLVYTNASRTTTGLVLTADTTTSNELYFADPSFWHHINMGVPIIYGSTPFSLFEDGSEFYLGRGTETTTTKVSFSQLLELTDGSPTTLHEHPILTSDITTSGNFVELTVASAFSTTFSVSGNVIRGNCTTTYKIGRVVHLSTTSGLWEPSNNPEEETTPAIGLIADEQMTQARILLQGVLQANQSLDGPFAGSEGQLIYLDTGFFTTVRPSTSGLIVQILGVVTTSSSIYFNPQLVTAKLG